MDIPSIFNSTESGHRIHNPITPEKLATLGAALPLALALLAISCRCPQTGRAVSATHADPRGFKVVATSPVDAEELDALVRCVEDLKGSGHDIDRITRIRFSSPSRAAVDFLWSGGFHAGELVIAKEKQGWTLVHEAYYP